ncbi:MAG: cell filamentation protein Fic [Verrucomicrobia bacterium]|nr:cell filamentation protein Fic [Verrucomicrobiota bacterium]
MQRNLYPVLAKLFPGALVSHRSALEGRPATDGTIFLTYRYTKKVELPGLTVRLISGRGPCAQDMAFVGGLHIACEARAYLENMQPARSRGTVAKCLSRAEVESRLEKLCRIRGEEGLNKLRDAARGLSCELGMEAEFDALAGVIGAILSSRPAESLRHPAARARAMGQPYDPDRVGLFHALFGELKSSELDMAVENRTSADEVRNLAFFEAYFSNYIEGTEFELEEAREICFENRIPRERPVDAHDILGTFRVVSDPAQMGRVPRSIESFVDMLRDRHATVMAAHTGVRPGVFKEKPNRAGETQFVDPELVRGTLGHAFDLLQGLEHPLARAAFIMFSVAEIHPFTDGNGRVARIMMNAELVHGGLVKIMIPTVYRDDYLLALRALSRQGRAGPLVRMLTHAQRFCSEIDFKDFDHARHRLEVANAFKEPDEARLRLSG